MLNPLGRTLSALALTGVFLLSASAGYAQKHAIDKSNLRLEPGPGTVKAPGATPAPKGWPPAPAGTQYFRLTAFNGYYDIQKQKYFYFSTNANKWIGGNQPPGVYRSQDPSTYGATPINYHGTSPWMEKKVEPGGQPSLPNGHQPATQPMVPPNTGRPATNGQPSGNNQ